MKNRIFLLLFLFTFLASSHAYSQFAIGANLGTNAPIKDGQNVGFGIGLKGMYFISPKVGIGLSINRLAYSKNSVTSSITGTTPFVNLFFAEEGFRPYIGTDVGLYSSSVEFGSFSSSTSDFGIAPTLGALYDLGGNFSLDFNLKYTLVFSKGTTGSYLPINVGVLYTLGK